MLAKIIPLSMWWQWKNGFNLSINFFTKFSIEKTIEERPDPLNIVEKMRIWERIFRCHQNLGALTTLFLNTRNEKNSQLFNELILEEIVEIFRLANEKGDGETKESFVIDLFQKEYFINEETAVA